MANDAKNANKRSQAKCTILRINSVVPNTVCQVYTLKEMDLKEATLRWVHLLYYKAQPVISI